MKKWLLCGSHFYFCNFRLYFTRMTKAEKLYHEIAAEIPDCKESKMFGALCIKAPNGKAGVMFWKEEYMIFKLDGETLEQALKLKGAKLFDPMGGRPMGGWVQLSETHISKWKKYAAISMELVKKLKK
jgi:hypothetical protein